MSMLAIMTIGQTHPPGCGQLNSENSMDLISDAAAAIIDTGAAGICTNSADAGTAGPLRL